MITMSSSVPEFLLLSATLLDALPSSSPIDDTLLLQLHIVFGPMLMSALQLIDRREVVRVILPTGRHVYQVASSAGKSYTLYINTPDSSIHEKTSLVNEPEPGEASENVQLNQLPSDPFAVSSDISGWQRDQSKRSEISISESEESRRRRIHASGKELQRMYCPCAGFSYNSLSGGQNVLCKHLLAVVIARKTSTWVEGSVGMEGVAAIVT
ncbi:hypothetical protein CNF02600 [Cryptococcus deneoformans JEC21]|uniref:SWIM-type domain-containing protein n=1 Tax=Cryptococcus deneoformans (strain JEC21 / ATCC MYA-565) TaxID=214684 RepID=Q5KF89_CRYD1|nr:hypothetical protein CNF02600 [Cryptococcus neoformans var. neoformans JEC21]AAW44044.2 hypothetical protein CNF02600 [Cryptococcus neoformans var. neoformans JEC21]